MKNKSFYTHYYELEKQFDMKQLLSYEKSARVDIERLKEEIENLEKYRLQIFEQAQKTANTEFKTIVKVYRQKYDSVQFFISVYTTPIWEDVTNFHNHIISEKIFNERYPGKERHNVIKLANDLVKQYNAVLIKNF